MASRKTMRNTRYKKKGSKKTTKSRSTRKNMSLTKKVEQNKKRRKMAFHRLLTTIL